MDLLKVNTHPDSDVCIPFVPEKANPGNAMKVMKTAMETAMKTATKTAMKKKSNAAMKDKETESNAVKKTAMKTATKTAMKVMKAQKNKKAKI